jgi:nucleotide-binding universal stress UspA family protein
MNRWPTFILRSISAHGLHGPAASGIARLAESVSAELVVVGTSGRTGLSRVQMGSVA